MQDLIFFLKKKGNDNNSSKNTIVETLGLNHIERSTRDRKLLKKEQDVFVVTSKLLENKEIVNIFKVITQLQNIISIHPSSPNPGCDIVLKDKLEMDNSNKI